MVGYKTICILTENVVKQEASDVLRYVFKHLSEQPDVTIHTVGEVAGFKSSTIAQVVRLLAATLSVEDDSYLLTGDVDMLPLSTHWFNQQDFKANFHVFNADAYRLQPNRNFQMCYLGGTKSTWKSLMGLGNGSLTDELSLLLRGREDSWSLDEGLLASKMTSWPLFESCQLLYRGYPTGGGYAPYRLDRGQWKLPNDLSKLIDCHCSRPLTAGWPLIEHLVDYFLPTDSRAPAKSYVEDLKKLRT
jgi:hypothetical protein